jgi:limonene-1,2-epoxide hydrolase
MTRIVVEEFLAAVGRGPDEIGDRLASDVVYRAADLPVLAGRLAVQRLWGRLFRRYGEIAVAPLLAVEDEDVVLVRQSRTFGRGGDAFELPGVAVYVVRDGLVVHWRDCFDRGDLSAADQALWPRLWRARW